MAAGLGVALVPESIVSLTLGGNVVYRPLAGVTESMELRVVYRRLGKEPALRTFLEVVRGLSRESPLPQALEVDDEAVLHIALQHPLVGVIDLLDGDQLDV
ncbi:LysR substrate-binding domain-containing protein [Hyalangium rubrum]|uniref:LysR substrate-binding domain-containing protein n=1 Tax=Hyalangium rubrum TaxID=3103134 RepID=UPI003BF581CB